MGLKLRMMEPSIDSQPGAGAEDDDTIARSLAEERETIAGLDEDPYSEDLAPKMVAVCNALEKARRFVWRARDKHHAKMTAAQAIVDAASEVAANTVAAESFVGIQSGQVARRAAAREVETRAARATAEAVSADLADDGAAVGGAFEDAFVALADAFDAAYRDWSGPATLARGADTSLESLYRQGALESELRAMQRPASTARAQLAGIVRDGDEKKLQLFTRAARSLAIEIRDAKPQQLQARFSGGLSTDGAVEERSQALLLLRDLDALRLTNRPPSLLAASNLLGMARVYARQVFGDEPSYCVASEFQIRNMPENVRSLEAAKKPWARNSKWFARFLPPSTLAVPGWSPVAARTSSGAVVRARKVG